MLERENVGGFYLDVMQGCSLPCYWTPHGHTAAGGDSMTRGMHELVEIIANAVKARDPQAITTGENASENMIDVTDGVLQVTLWPENTAPIFAAVYQDYILRYGLELSAGAGWRGRYEDTWQQDAFFIECASLFVEGMQVGRIRLRPRDNNISFRRPEHREMLNFLGRVVGYYRQDVAKKFLVYGQLMRLLAFLEPSPMPMLAYGSYLDKSSGRFPALMSGVFRSEDGELGMFVVNASAKELAFRAELAPTRYGMSAGHALDVDAIASDGTSSRALTDAKGVVPLDGSLPAHDMTLFRLK